MIVADNSHRISPEGIERIRQSKLAFWADPGKKARTKRNISKAVIEAFKDPITRHNFEEGNRRKWEDAENSQRIRENISAAVKKAHKDPTKHYRDPKVLRSKSRSMQRAWKEQAPEHRQNWVNAIGRTSRTPEARKRQSEISTGMWSEAPYRKQQSASRRAAWARPDVRKRRGIAMQQAATRPEVKERKSEAMKERWVKVNAILRAAAGAPKKPRGRQPGLSSDLKRRIELTAAFLRLNWSESAMSKFVYPETPATAYANTRKLASRHRVMIAALKQSFNRTDAQLMVGRYVAPNA